MVRAGRRALNVPACLPCRTDSCFFERLETGISRWAEGCTACWGTVPSLLAAADPLPVPHVLCCAVLCCAGELYDQIRLRGHLDEPTARFYAAEVVIMLEELRRRGVVHR